MKRGNWKTFPAFPAGRRGEGLATWSTEIDLASPGLREKIRQVLKIHGRPETYSG